MNNNVIDFYTRRRFPKPDTDTNDRDAVDFGRYVGVLPKRTSGIIRDHIADMERKRVQLEKMTEEFRVMWEAHYDITIEALNVLGAGADAFKPAEQELYVDKGGHCWLVDTTKRDGIPKE